MKKIVLLFSLIVITTTSAFAFEYKKMKFKDFITDEMVVEECGYNKNGVLRCKGDTVSDDFVPTKYSTGYDYQNKKNYTIIEKGKDITVYSQGKKIYYQTKN